MHNPDHIRDLLKSWVAKSTPYDGDEVFIGELCFSDRTRRADLVHANGKLSAYEIKSASDTLSRWQDQQEAYLSCFDQVWLCCHSNHIEKAFNVTNRCVGILLIDDLGSIAVARKAGTNRLRDKLILTGLLWRTELNELCREFEIPVKSKMKIGDVRLAITEALDWDPIRDTVLARLKERYSNDQIKSSIDSSSPSDSY